MQSENKKTQNTNIIVNTGFCFNFCIYLILIDNGIWSCFDILSYVIKNDTLNQLKIFWILSENIIFHA